jgi:hypothetical protein
VVLGPDKMIYVMNGNHTKVPKDIAETSPHIHYQEDFLLARQWDAGGHAVGILAPGGHVLRTDPEGKRWELMLAGFRHAVQRAAHAGPIQLRPKPRNAVTRVLRPAQHAAA